MYKYVLIAFKKKNLQRVATTYLTYKNCMFILPGIPLVSVTYLAIWTFIDVLPSTCKDTSSRLDSLKDKLANYCRFLNINATVQFTYSFVAFQVFL